jgi:hypothetical protein
MRQNTDKHNTKVIDALMLAMEVDIPEPASLLGAFCF